jgi:cell wall-associated NlpC family hydrolase
MRRRLFPSVLVALLAAAPAGAAKTKPSWAQAEIKAVVAAGLMTDDPAGFRPDDPLTRGVLKQLVAGLKESAPVAPAKPDAKVTIAALDSRLVGALGLADASKLFADGARAAGVTIPSRFGPEAVARLLALRTNHPANEDELELLPSDPATRAEAAFSAAKILRFGAWQQDYVRAAATTFALPPLSAWQKRILTTAFRFIGYPYVWGGTSETAEAPLGHQARGGFDCSGFVWRVYKLERYPSSGRLADALQGRTTYAMSGEVTASKRIPYAKLQPGDVVFFGQGSSSKPAQIGHMGIYVGNGWFVHSSGYGVALAQMTTGWYRTSFAWGRRPLAEANVSTSERVFAPKSP